MIPEVQTLLDRLARHNSGARGGITSVCGAHPLVIEATCNQVNRVSAALDEVDIPEPLISQCLPRQFPAVVRGDLPARSRPLLISAVRAALAPHGRACAAAPPPPPPLNAVPGLCGKPGFQSDGCRSPCDLRRGGSPCGSHRPARGRRASARGGTPPAGDRTPDHAILNLASAEELRTAMCCGGIPALHGSQPKRRGGDRAACRSSLVRTPWKIGQSVPAESLQRSHNDHCPTRTASGSPSGSVTNGPERTEPESRQ